MPIRKDSLIADIYNDGTVVYLYDESFRDRLSSLVAPPLVLGTDDREDADALRKSIVDDKLMVAYELLGDDEVYLEVSVGKALTAKEKKGRKWLKVQKALISLPTGKLRVESANSCSIEGRKDPEEGATLEVPPGEYMLSLFRADPMGDDEDDNDEEKIVSEVVVLTPIAEAKPPKKWDAFLSWLQASGAEPLRFSKPRIEGDVFHGSLIRDEVWNFTNLRIQDLRKLDVRFGDVIEFKVNGEKRQALYSANFSKSGLQRYLGFGQENSDKEPPVLATAMYHDRQRQTVIVLENISGNEYGRVGAGKEERSISIRRLDNPFFPRFNDSHIGSAEKLPEGKVKSKILLVGKNAMLVDFDLKAQEHLGIKREGVFYLTFDNITRELHTSSNVLLERDKLIRKKEKITPEIQKRSDELHHEAWELLEKMNKIKKISERNALYLKREAILREREKIRVPKELLPTMPLYAVFSSHVENSNRQVLWILHLIGGDYYMKFNVGDTILFHKNKK